MRVLKFGGTSIGDRESLGQAIEIIRERSGEPLVVVLSAMGSTTDRLEEIASLASEGDVRASLEAVAVVGRFHRRAIRALIEPGAERSRLESFCSDRLRLLKEMVHSLGVLGDLSPAVKDRVLGLGELLATRVVTSALVEAGLPAAQVDARRCVITNGRHGRAEPLWAPTREACLAVLQPLLDSGSIAVTQGFVARSEAGTPTTLGRGGSDYSASLIGAALEADEIEIWTDVDGIMTADPTLVPAARGIPVMSFREASELAMFGARVIHPGALAPAVERNIPVRVLNTHRRRGQGTVILAETSCSGGAVKSIAYKEGMTLLNLESSKMFRAHDFLAKVFTVFDRQGVSPDIVATSEVSVAVAVLDAEGLDEVVARLAELGTVSVRSDQAVVCVVGERLMMTPGIVSRVFEDLGDVNTSMLSLGGSEIALSFAVDESDLARVVPRLHRRFFEPAEGSQAETADRDLRVAVAG